MDRTNGNFKQNQKKCSYYDRGHCIYGQNCQFIHSSQTREQKDKCNKANCEKPHPKKCKYSNQCILDPLVPMTTALTTVQMTINTLKKQKIEDEKYVVGNDESLYTTQDTVDESL